MTVRRYRSEAVEKMWEDAITMDSAAKMFVTLLASAKYEPRSYSGRGMYGARCVSVTVDPRCVLGLGAWLAVQAEADRLDIVRVAELMDSAREDSMGRDVVVYWPDVEWPDDLKEEA